jgi:hypothetical protein
LYVWIVGNTKSSVDAFLCSVNALVLNRDQILVKFEGIQFLCFESSRVGYFLHCLRISIEFNEFSYVFVFLKSLLFRVTSYMNIEAVYLLKAYVVISYYIAVLFLRLLFAEEFQYGFLIQFPSSPRNSEFLEGKSASPPKLNCDPYFLVNGLLYDHQI